jgi:hypothetical protein
MSNAKHQDMYIENSPVITYTNDDVDEMASARQGKAKARLITFNVLNICYRKIFLWATTQVNKDKY